MTAPKPDTHATSLPPITDGWTLTALAADNLRALIMPVPIQLRRLLLIVGRNGIGKSTLARVFPLLRQSFGTRIREPLLWWERDQVDFGSFADAIRRGADEMTFTFEFSHPTLPSWQVSTTLCAAPEGSRVRSVGYATGSDHLTLSFAEDGTLDQLTGSIDNSNECRQQLAGESAQPGRLFGVAKTPEHPDPLAMSGFSPTDMPDDGITKRREAHFCTSALQHLRYAERLITQLATRTAYLGPFRAEPQRLYRHQSVAIEQLDPRGANLTMFFAALNDTERIALNDFLHRSLNFRVQIKQSKGQYELRIDLDGQTYNILDVGFGYSQILPVAVQLWAAGQPKLSTSRTTDPITVMVVEQPELHLHPHHQVLVARTMATAAMTDHGPMQIVETHSDHLVSEIGMLVAEGKLDTDRVGVLFIEPVEGGAGVDMATYAKNGVLQNWPAGFLTP